MVSHFSTDLQVAVVYQKDAAIHRQKEGKKTKCMFQNIYKKNKNGFANCFEEGNEINKFISVHNAFC